MRRQTFPLNNPLSVVNDETPSSREAVGVLVRDCGKNWSRFFKSPVLRRTLAGSTLLGRVCQGFIGVIPGGSW